MHSEQATAWLETHGNKKLLAVMAAIENSLAMIEFDMAGCVLYANENFACTMGYESSEMIGMRHASFCAPEFRNSSQYLALWEGLRQGKSFQNKIQRIRKDGRPVWLEATYMPIRDEEGIPSGVLKIATNIDEREKAAARLTEDFLQMSEELLNRAREGMARGKEIDDAVGNVVSGSEDNMEVLRQLERQSDFIRGLVRSIKDVAEQTNLLALNAAIEAAHAKEHGRGFAVVASEVRKLATQVQQATREASGYVEGIMTHVREVGKSTKRSQILAAESLRRIQQAVGEFQGIEEAAHKLDGKANEIKRILN